MLRWVGKGWTRQMCIGGETGGSSRDRGKEEEKKKREERVRWNCKKECRKGWKQRGMYVQKDLRKEKKKIKMKRKRETNEKY